MKTIRDYTFEEFSEKVCSNFNIDKVADMSQYGRFEVFINGIKFEIKRKYIVIGYSLPEESLNSIRSSLEGKYKLIANQQTSVINVEYDTSEESDDLSYFISLVSFVLALGIETNKNFNRSSKLFDSKYCPLTIANRYFYAIANKDQDMLDLSRFLLSADKYRSVISFNAKTEENSYCEHLVPCVMIHNQAIKMTVEGASPVEVAQMIKTNLCCFYIKPSDAYRLDYELGLQTSMPEGWKFGDSVFARLVAADIEH